MKKDPEWLDYYEDRMEERAENEEYFQKLGKDTTKQNKDKKKK